MPSKVRGIPPYETKDLSSELESQNKEKCPLSSQACLYMLMTSPRRYSHFLCVLWDVSPHHRNKKTWQLKINKYFMHAFLWNT